MAKRPKDKQEGAFRIKDLETGLYWSRNTIYGWELLPDGTKKRIWSHWHTTGSVYLKRGPAEIVVTKLTRTYKDKRDTQAKIILYGDEKTARYKVVECDIVDKP